jgi:asparagine N-glycosylation enzyme membrane subunit Stt3
MRAPVAVAGLLGGLCWLAAFVLDEVRGGGGVDLLGWAGLALLGITVLGAGAGLVSRSATWLRVIVAVCFAALVWSVREVLRDSVDGLAVDAALGAVAVVVSVVVLTRRPRGGGAPPPPPGPGGPRPRRSHAH